MTLGAIDGHWTLYHSDASQEVRLDRHTVPIDLEPIPSRVPGNVELDLFSAGIEPDPFFGENIYLYKKYEYHTWWYMKTFTLSEVEVTAADGADGETIRVPESESVDRLFLTFHGLDTYATVWLNGTEIGRADNMMIEHSFPAGGAIDREGENVLVVEITPSLAHAWNQEYTAHVFSAGFADERVRLRKATHSFGWDIAPRFVSAGIWRSVELEYRPLPRIREAYITTKHIGRDHAVLLLRYRLEAEFGSIEGVRLRITGRLYSHHGEGGEAGDGEPDLDGAAFRVEVPVRFVSESVDIPVHEPRLWWPRGYGDPNLYAIRLELMRDDAILDSRSETVGIRTVELQTDYSPDPQEQEFRLRVNGREIFALGTNWVPLDAFHSRDAERLEPALEMLEDLSCNMVRCWGGNVYEDHAFFEYCDRHGIMVWQDFAFACAAYPQDDRFAAEVEQEAAAVIRKLRNHPSLMLWCGDNEIDQFYYQNGYRMEHAYHNRISREVLPRATGRHDPFRPYIPSSPYIPEPGRGHLEVPEQHNWGPRDYFKGDFYRRSSARFVSEIGYHGCPAASTLRSFLPEDELWPIGGRGWDTHNTDYLDHRTRGRNRIELMRDQVRILFGDEPDTLEEFILASQISQAEAKKFFIETSRLGRPERTGIIWWNLLDCWPQVSDAIVDYHFRRKLAYHYIRRVQSETCVMIGEPKEWVYPVHVDNISSESRVVEYTVQEAKDTTPTAIPTPTIEGRIEIPPGACIRVGEIPALPGEQRLFLLRWKSSGREFGNHYASGSVPYSLSRYKTWLQQIEALPEPFSVRECID